MCFSGPTLDGGLKGGVGFDLVGHISLRWLRKMPVEDNNSNCCHVDVSNVLYRWIIAIKASIKKWLPLHQALRDYLNQPPEETRMWGSVLCEYWQQPTSPCGSLDESPVCPLLLCCQFVKEDNITQEDFYSANQLDSQDQVIRQSYESFLPGFRLCTCGWTTVVQTNQCPMRNL